MLLWGEAGDFDAAFGSCFGIGLGTGWSALSRAVVGLSDGGGALYSCGCTDDSDFTWLMLPSWI